MSEALFSGWQPQSQQQPRLELVEALWDLLSPKDRILTCAICQTDAGQELRLSCPGDDLVRSEFVRSLDTARLKAVALRIELTKQGFREAPPYSQV